MPRVLPLLALFSLAAGSARTHTAEVQHPRRRGLLPARVPLPLRHRPLRPGAGGPGGRAA